MRKIMYKRLFRVFALTGLAGGNLIAAQFDVTTLADSGVGSLRWAMMLADIDDSINLDLSLNGTIVLASPLPIISTSMEINGNGLVTIDGGNQYQVFFISNGSVSICDLDINNGLSAGGDGGFAFSGGGGGALGAGGGLFVDSLATVNLTNIHFYANGAQGGFGGTTGNIYNNGTGGGGGGGFNNGLGGSGGANFGAGGGGGGGGGFNSFGGAGINGGGGGGGFSGTIFGTVIDGTGNDASVASGGDGGMGPLDVGGSGGAPNMQGSSADPLFGGGGGGGGGTLDPTLDGASGGTAGIIGGGGGGGGGATNGRGSGGGNFGGGGGSGGSISFSDVSISLFGESFSSFFEDNFSIFGNSISLFGRTSGGDGGFAGGGGGGGGGPIGGYGTDGGQGGFGAGGGGAGLGAIGGLGGNFGGLGGSNNGSGGGGGALGGAIFVRSGGVINLNNVFFDNSSVTAGPAGTGDNQGDAGTASGADIFLMNKTVSNYFSSENDKIVNCSGDGQFFKNGPGKLALNVDSANGIYPNLTINDGTLVLQGQVDNAVINTSGILYGNGTVNNLVNHGVIAPSGPNGSFNVNGFYTQFFEGDLQIGIAPSGQSDCLFISGQAKLSGTLVIIPLSGTFLNGTKYTILEAQGGINGRFSKISVPTNLKVKIHYYDTGVVLEILKG